MPENAKTGILVFWKHGKYNFFSVKSFANSENVLPSNIFGINHVGVDD